MLADVKFIPSPPALVDNKNIQVFDSLLLNESIIFYLSIIDVYPSNRSYKYPLKERNSANMSSIIVNYENISIFRPYF